MKKEVPNFLRKIQKNKQNEFHIEDFKLLKILHSISYKDEYSAIYKKNCTFCKIIRYKKYILSKEDPDILSKIISKIRISCKIDHPYILKTYGLFDDEEYLYTIS
jgi:hypothetical protein